MSGTNPDMFDSPYDSFFIPNLPCYRVPKKNSPGFSRSGVEKALRAV
ncbi:hypothetical protein [Candidatus Electronema sp. JC]